MILMTGCSEETFVSSSPVIEETEDTFTIDLMLNVAQIQGISTRALTDKPDYGNLKLYVLEFEDTGNPSNNQNSADYTSSVTSISIVNHTEEDGNTIQDLHFKVTLQKYDTPDPRILHFIAVPKDVDLTYDLGGFEDPMIRSLYIGNGNPAYWQRVEFPQGYGAKDSDGVWKQNDYMLTKLEHIPMLCNFAKVSMHAAEDAGFTLEGFALINQPTMGTIAPWNTATSEFPTFLDGNDKILPYGTIDETYKGFWPFNAVNDVAEKNVNDAVFDNNDKFLYEKPRPSSSLYNPVVIMKVKFTEDGASMFYKLDLGKPNNDNLFEYYDILRNFDYAITVNSVRTEGYSTAQAAMDGVVYNNFSFDVNTQSMLQVSNGTQSFRVNKTTIVVTRPEDTTQTLLYRFKENISQPAASNSRIEPIVDKGTAILSYENGTSDDESGWRSLTITTAEPAGEQKTGEIVLYDKETGLGRTITVIVRSPFKYSDLSVWGGNYNYYAQFNAKDADGIFYRQGWDGRVSNSTDLNQPLTVRFKIEDNIDESMFPLEFTFESSRQNIQNNYIGNQQVKTGESYFNNEATTIKYTKTVSWLDYNSDLTADNPLGTIVTEEDGKTYHIVRARFLTIAPIGTGEQTTIRIYNPYTRIDDTDYADVTFTGVTGVAPDFSLEDGSTPGNAASVTHPN